MPCTAARLETEDALMSQKLSRSAPRLSGEVIPLPLPSVCPQSVEALLLLARQRTAWNQSHPQATFDEQLAAGAAISEKLGI
jgi:hypothetical protein